MILYNRDKGISFYCPDCKTLFGIPQAQDKMHCPLCNKLLGEKLIRVIQIDHVTYRCCCCHIKFGAVLQDNEMIKCPVCPSDKIRKGG